MKSSESISRSPTLTQRVQILMIKIRLILQPSLDRLHGDPIPFYPWESVGHGGHSRSDPKRWASGTHKTNVQQVNALLKSKKASFTGLQKQFSDDHLVFSCSFLPSFSAWWLKAEYNIDVAVYSFQGSNSRSSSVKGREITFNERISSHCFQKSICCDHHTGRYCDAVQWRAVQCASNFITRTLHSGMLGGTHTTTRDTVWCSCNGVHDRHNKCPTNTRLSV